MLYINYKITLLLTVVLVLNAIIMVKTVSVKIKKAGSIREEVQNFFYEIINRSFGNFKFIKLQSNDKDILNEFSNASSTYAKVNITNQTLSQVPRLFLEAVSFGIIIFIITYLVYKYQDDVSSLLAMITMFILALYRLMPSLNRIMSSYNQILFYSKSLDIIHNDLMYDNEDLGDKKVLFQLNLKLILLVSQ